MYYVKYLHLCEIHFNFVWQRSGAFASLQRSSQYTTIGRA